MIRPVTASRLLGLLTATTFLACGGEPAREPEAGAGDATRMGGTAGVCYQRDIESLNAFVSPDLAAADLRLLLFTPLALYGEDGEYEPYLASSWEWQEDDRRLRLTIRDDVTWHDSARVTAEDVAWTLDIATDPDYGYLSEDFRTLQEVAVSDSLTVELRFSEPFILGLEPFVWLPILPKHLLDDLPPERFAEADFHRAPVGSGPFRFVEQRSDGSRVFARWEGFPEALGGSANLERIVIRSVPEPTGIMAEMVGGSLHLCIGGSRLAERAADAEQVAASTLQPVQSAVIPLNTESAPLGDPRVRRALSAALERSTIATAVSSVAEPDRNPLPDGSPWYDPDVEQPDADTALAAALLDSAGWRRTNGIRRNAAGRELQISLVAPAAQEDFLTVVQAQLRRVGVDVDLRFMEWASYVELIQDPSRRPDAMALALSPEKIFAFHGDLYELFHTEGFANLGGYSIAKVDSLLEVLSAPLPAERRGEAYRLVQQRVAEDVPMIYTISLPRVAVIGPRLQGYDADLNGPFVSVTEWWLRR